jgi:hypothetical protein
MKSKQPSRDEFLAQQPKEINKMIAEKGTPKTVVFVADGNSRIAVIRSGNQPPSDDFYEEYKNFIITNTRRVIKLFFKYNLHTLFVPIISEKVLERGKMYLKKGLLPILQTIFFESDWLELYNKLGLKVKVYGDVEKLKQTDCAPAFEWIQRCLKLTEKNQKSFLYYGIAGTTNLGIDLMKKGIEFFKKYKRVPTIPEQIKFYYGEKLDDVDLFIMSTKFKGVNAFPPLISGKKTNVYYQLVPGLLGFNEKVYREILYDLLFCRKDSILYDEHAKSEITLDRELIKNYYHKHQSYIIGPGKILNGFWVPEIAEL